ncbi:MAG: divalent-cation tolerance protein CutA [Firmicutes bacterium]|nr:divalent-cation tolerance protein CutA [Bacillota bacterium]
MGYVLLYITAPNREEADSIGRSLVERRLAACVNILPQIQSFYWWEGQVQADSEVLLLAKTREELVEPAIAAVKQMHSYTVPAILAIEIKKDNPDFLKWLDEETNLG